MDNDRAFKGRLSDQTAYPFAAIVVLAFAGIIGVGVATGKGVEVAPAPSVASRASASSIETPRPMGTTSAPNLAPASSPNMPSGVRSVSAIGPGLYTMTHNALRIRLTVPSGWKAENDAPAIYRTPAAYLRLHDVARVVTDVCAPGPALEVGPSAADLVVALSKQVGVERVGPRDVTVGGHPATRFVLYTQFPYCSDREGLLIFQDVGNPFGLAIFGIAAVTVYVVDVDGERLVITTDRSSVQSNEELDAIVESMEIDRMPESPPEPLDDIAFPQPGGLMPGWYAARTTPPGTRRCCDGPEFFFMLATRGWVARATGQAQGAVEMTKAVEGSPSWAVLRFSDPTHVYRDPCVPDRGPAVGASVDDLAGAMTSIAGTDATDPTDVLLRFSTARHFVLTVRQDIACDHDNFVLWSDELHGMRRPSAPGSTIRIWAFHPNDRAVFAPIVVEAETFGKANVAIVREIEQIVQSIFHGG